MNIGRIMAQFVDKPMYAGAILFASGVICGVVGCKGGIPITGKEHQTNYLRNWTQANNNDAIAHATTRQPNSYATLIKCIDHMTRPTRVVAAQDDQYKVVVGTNNDRLVHIMDWFDLDRANKQKYTECLNAVRQDPSLTEKERAFNYDYLIREIRSFYEPAYNNGICQANVSRALMKHSLAVPSKYVQIPITSL